MSAFWEFLLAKCRPVLTNSRICTWQPSSATYQAELVPTVKPIVNIISFNPLTAQGEAISMQNLFPQEQMKGREGAAAGSRLDRVPRSQGVEKSTLVFHGGAEVGTSESGDDDRAGCHS